MLNNILLYFELRDKVNKPAQLFFKTSTGYRNVIIRKVTPVSVEYEWLYGNKHQIKTGTYKTLLSDVVSLSFNDMELYETYLEFCKEQEFKSNDYEQSITDR